MLLVRSHCSFKKGIASRDGIIKETSEIVNALNNKTMAGSIFCDLEKAFDSVNHDLLLSKLCYYGVSCKAILSLKFYLQDRYQRGQIINSFLDSNIVSEWTKIKYGMPQGSIFGPLLFLLYINELPKAIGHKTIPILLAADISKAQILLNFKMILI
jgi:hypothetical protein